MTKRAADKITAGLNEAIGYARGWNDAIELAAKTAVDHGDHLEIHSPRIATEIRKLKKAAIGDK